MVKSISEKYGPRPRFSRTSLAIRIAIMKQEKGPSRRGKDSQRSLNLVRSSFSNRFGLIIYTKKVNADVQLAVTEAVRVEKLEAPAREAERQKKQTDDRELARQKNQKSFRP